MNQNEEMAESDRAKIAFMLSLGIPATRTDFRNNVLTYWFPKEKAVNALKAWESPEMSQVREYVKKQKQVNAHYLAMREAAKHSQH